MTRREKLYFSGVIKVSGCIFGSVAKSCRQGVDAILCVGIGYKSADDAESVRNERTHKKKQKKTSSIAVDYIPVVSSPWLTSNTNNNNNNLRDEKKQNAEEKTENDSLAFVTPFLEWLFFSTATTYYYLQTKTDISTTIISGGFSLFMSSLFFSLLSRLGGGGRRGDQCLLWSHTK